MFKARYLLSDVARILRRSEQSLIRDIEAGILKVGGVTGGTRRTGTNPDYAVTLGDLEHYLGKDKARRIFGSPTHKRTPQAEAPPAKPQARYKKCRSCGKLKPLSDFPREASEQDWLSADCSTCIELRKKRR